MAIIYTYPNLQNPQGNELIVVSDVNNNNATRLMSVAAIAALVPGGGDTSGCPTFYILTPFIRDAISGECIVDTSKEVITTCQGQFANHLFNDTGRFVLLDSGNTCYKVTQQPTYSDITNVTCTSCAVSGAIDTWKLVSCPVSEESTIIYSTVNADAALNQVMRGDDGLCYFVESKQDDESPTGAIDIEATFADCPTCQYPNNNKYLKCDGAPEDYIVLTGTSNPNIEADVDGETNCYQFIGPCYEPATLNVTILGTYEDCTCTGENIYELKNCTTNGTLGYTTESNTPGVANSFAQGYIVGIAGSCYNVIEYFGSPQPLSSYTIVHSYVENDTNYPEEREDVCQCCTSTNRKFTNCDTTDEFKYVFNSADFGLAFNDGFNANQVYTVELNTGVQICVVPGECTKDEQTHEIVAFNEEVDCETCLNNLPADLLNWYYCNSPGDVNTANSSAFANTTPGTYSSTFTRDCFVVAPYVTGTPNIDPPGGVWSLEIANDAAVSACECCDAEYVLYVKCKTCESFVHPAQFSILESNLPGGSIAGNDFVVLTDNATEEACCYTLNPTTEQCANGKLVDDLYPVGAFSVTNPSIEDCSDPNCSTR